MTLTENQQRVVDTLLARQNPVSNAVGRALLASRFKEKVPLETIMADEVLIAAARERAETPGITAGWLYRNLKKMMATLNGSAVRPLIPDILEDHFPIVQTGIEYKLAAGAHYFTWMRSMGEPTHDPNMIVLSWVMTAKMLDVKLQPRAMLQTAEFTDEEVRAIWRTANQEPIWAGIFQPAEEVCHRCMSVAMPGNSVCANHWTVCHDSSCEEGWETGSQTSNFCPAHRHTCDTCTREIPTTELRCDNCRIGRLDGYQHTEPTMWLGGPLPHTTFRGREMDEGYYIGFELEIGTDEPFPNSVRDWANDHMGHRGALQCKRDGSVEGFEIASQPMTPEFFEGIDWDNFFQKLDDDNPLFDHMAEEPREHGLHVHIGKIAFRHSTTAMAAFCHLIDLDNSLARIGRRAPYHYCNKVDKRVTIAGTTKNDRQGRRLRNNGWLAGRDAVNLTNGATVEIRAFKSTRSPQDLRNAVRWVYLTADYIRELQLKGLTASAKHVNLSAFEKWIKENHADKAWALLSPDYEGE